MNKREKKKSHLQRYGVTVRGNVTIVDPPLEVHYDASKPYSNNMAIKNTL